MATFGPDSGITKADLFNHIVENIDETLSGETTGWDIEYDARGENFTPINRRQEGLNATTLTHRTYTNFGGGTFDPYPMGVTEYQGQAALLLNLRNSSNASSRAAFAVSQDGGYSFGDAQAFPAGLGSATQVLSFTYIKQAFTGDPDPSYLAAYCRSAAPSTLLVDIPNRNPLAYLGQAGSPLSISVTGNVVAYSKMHGFQDKDDETKHHFFLVRNSGSHIGYYPVNHANFAATPTAGTSVESYIAAATLNVTQILGVDDVYFDATENKYFMSVSVEHSSEKKVILLRSTTTTLSSTSWTVVDANYNNRLDPSGNDSDYFSAGHRETVEEDRQFIVQRSEETSGTGDLIYSFSPVGSVDGNPDFQGLEYEYVVFKSQYETNNGQGYYLILLQLNPEQSSPPTVTGITDTQPIFARVVQNWDAGQPTKFFFDPIIPTSAIAGTYDALAPCLFTVPDILADPEETHRVWMKVDNRQVFVFAESTNGITQSLHVNILEPVVTLTETSNVLQRNDNHFVSSAGVDGGFGAIFLGRNGATEADLVDRRNDDRPYYPRGQELTYSSVLTDVNSVDDTTVNFDIIVGSNTSDFNTAPNGTYRYVAGKLYGALYPTVIGELESGDIVEINSQDYMYFHSSDPDADIHAPAVLQDLLILWS